ncbi:MAG: aminotransferase class IV [Phycisphaerales bacterium]|nr:aminotransferase class IV [Phycisphaerales bacterium]
MNIHLNGSVIPASEARISPFDRAYLLGDALYEGIRAYRGHLRAMHRHVERLQHSLDIAQVDWDASCLESLTHDLLRANGLRDAFVYWQISRGVPGPGDPVRTRVPVRPMTPTVFGYAIPAEPIESYVAPAAIAASTVEDIRWLRGRLKSISLMGNVLGAMEALDAGGADAIFCRDGLLAEATASNVIIVRKGEVLTPDLDSVSILAGVTRSIILDAMPEIIVRPVTVDELREADEVILCGTTSVVTSVVALDDERVGTGRPGLVAERMLRAYVGAVTSDIEAKGAA